MIFDRREIKKERTTIPHEKYKNKIGVNLMLVCTEFCLNIKNIFEMFIWVIFIFEINILANTPI